MKTGVCTFTDENRSKVRKPLKLGADVTASDKHTTKCSLWLKCCSPVWYKILKPQPSLIRDFILCHSTESRLQICNEKRTKEWECVWVTYAEIKEIWNEGFFCAGTPHIVKASLVAKFLPNKAHFVFAPQLRHCRASSWLCLTLALVWFALAHFGFLNNQQRSN